MLKYYPTIGLLFVLLSVFFSTLGFTAYKGLDQDIGLILYVDNPQDPQETLLFREIFYRTFSQVYGQSVVFLTSPVLDRDEILFLGAKKQVDHVVVVRGKGFLKPFDERKGETRFGFEFRGDAAIYDIGKMDRVGEGEILLDGSDVLFHSEQKGTRENAYGLFSKAILRTLGGFYNPNTLGHVQVKKAADYFYGKADCERALPLYDMAILDGDFDFDMISTIKNRQQECSLREKTKLRMASRYRLDLEFVNLSPNYHPYFEKALEKGHFRRRFSDYSDHPVTLSVRYLGKSSNPSPPGEMILTLLYDPLRYRVSSGLKPKRFDNALDFGPFHNVMQLLVEYQRLAVRLMPEQNRGFFSQFQPVVRLEKFNGDWLVFNVQVNPADKILTPTKMRLKVAGYQPTLVEQSKVVSDPVRYFFMGPAFNPDGKETIYNMVYKYFEITPS